MSSWAALILLTGEQLAVKLDVHLVVVTVAGGEGDLEDALTEHLDRVGHWPPVDHDLQLTLSSLVYINWKKIYIKLYFLFKYDFERDVLVL